MASPESKNIRRKRPLWMKVLMWVTGGVCALAAISIAVLCVILWTLTPSRLTPLVEKYANGYLNANVSVGRAELTLRPHFPILEIKVDSLTIVSNGLEGISATQRASLPVYADTLLNVPHLNGGINLAALMGGRLDISDVKLTRPAINMVYADSCHSNLDIMPPDSSETDNAPTELAAITIDRFRIEGEAPIRYFSLADSCSIELAIRSSELTPDGLPMYKITTTATASAAVESILPPTDIELGIDGHIHWSPESPQNIRLSDFNIHAGNLTATVDMTADMTDESPVVQEFTLSLNPTKITDIIDLVPDKWNESLRSLKSDMHVSGSVKLLKPYNLGSEQLPCIAVSFDIPDGRLNYERIHILKGGITANCEIIGDSLRGSWVNIQRLHAQGRAMDLAMEAKISEPFQDPFINGKFNGHINLSLLPETLKRMIPMQVKGIVNGHTDFRFRMSHLNQKSIHNVRMNGRLVLTGFNVTDRDSMELYLHSADIRLGTNRSFTRDSIRADSLLTLSAKIDSGWFNTPELYTRIKDITMGVGCKNTESMLDTSSITPIGATVNAGSVYYKSRIDSSRVFIRGMKSGVALKRFKGNSKAPMLGIRASLKRAFISDSQLRMSLHDGTLNIDAHLNPKTAMRRRMQVRYDSIAAAHPGISPDSIRRIMMSGYRRNIGGNDDAERMSLALDQGTAAIIRRLDLKGSLTAASGRLVTPMFPLRNRFTNLDCRFNTDSLIMNNAFLSAGESDLTISGTISNIRNTLIFSRSRRPLRIELSLNSDTINVNQLTQAVFKGMLAAQNDNRMSVVAETDDDNYTALTDSIVGDSGHVEEAVLIPVNVAADIKVNARNVIYSDVPMHDFHGELLVENGALNLRNLAARTDIGAASMNALYYAPRKSDIMFGLGLKLEDFHIGKVIQLLPQIDSIMPILNGINGIIDVNLATTTRIDSLMNFDIPSLKAALQMQGDSLVILDPDTYRTMAKWLMFKNKNKNMINHMEVEMIVENSMLELYPFVFDFDRYRLGVMGSNDLDMNLNYHVSVLKSPLPFKFGINITGNADDMKIRIGKSKFKENMVGERMAIADTTRINLITEIDQVFRRGLNAARLAPINVKRPVTHVSTQGPDTISASDSLTLIREGLIEAPVQMPEVPHEDKPNKKNRNKRK